MRRALIALLAAVVVATSGDVQAKFGMFKTKLHLVRLRPPETPVLGESVCVEAEAQEALVSRRHLSTIKRRVEESLGVIHRILDNPREADATVRVVIDELRADVHDETRHERKEVKVGERQEWNEKKQKNETKDVKEWRDVAVRWVVAQGSARATIETEGAGGRRSKVLRADYDESFKEGSGAPSFAGSDSELERYLVDVLSERAAGQVGFGSEPVEVLLADDGELKPGNEPAKEGRYAEALAQWSRLKLQGKKEAARVHNVGVAHEALAYTLPPHSPEHREHLETALEHYQIAIRLDGGEKHFPEALKRLEQSIAYSTAAQALAADLARYREEGRRKDRGAAKSRSEREDAPAAESAGPLRNGDFEARLSDWSVSGRVTIAEERGHGRVLELAADTGSARASQSLGLDAEDAASGQPHLALLYRVVSGQPLLRVTLDYRDREGRERSASFEPGGAPGEWTRWEKDLTALKFARLRSLRILVEGGTVRIDDIAVGVARAGR